MQRFKKDFKKEAFLIGGLSQNVGHKSYLDKVVRKESSFAVEGSFPPAAAHSLDVFDDVAGPDGQLVAEFGVVVEFHLDVDQAERRRHRRGRRCDGRRVGWNCKSLVTKEMSYVSC